MLAAIGILEIKNQMYKLDIFCTPEQQDLVLSTLHESGVDKIGNYDTAGLLGRLQGLTELSMAQLPYLEIREKWKTTHC
ncbi:hypothetical protein VCRA2116O29_190033 [Vibrio crassostreae]|nr:hypothetical protein EDB37_10422 [Vibrio crassostreae]CAK2422490.1 hypothetical protein VCRA2116O29_190033 [Vibrio crassostreae]CAK2500266.1 hypothetical protein VCRA2119O48_460001 [Vibrio crassostreae]CAK3028523.1 hypothetical protein VCRA2133E348_540033 [Vibrio crassostreae]CAK3545477.1 hypothetical protein VCRA213O314_590001 [Vibrio crassostreae]